MIFDNDFKIDIGFNEIGAFGTRHVLQLTNWQREAGGVPPNDSIVKTRDALVAELPHDL